MSAIINTNIQIHSYEAQAVPVAGPVVASPAMAFAGLGQMIQGAGGALIDSIKDIGKTDPPLFYHKSVERLKVGGKNLLYSLINTLSLGIFGRKMSKEFNQLKDCGLDEDIHQDIYGTEMSKTALWFGTDFYSKLSQTDINKLIESTKNDWSISPDDEWDLAV